MEALIKYTEQPAPKARQKVVEHEAERTAEPLEPPAIPNPSPERATARYSLTDFCVTILAPLQSAGACRPVIQGVRTPLCFVLHSWLPQPTPPALVNWVDLIRASLGTA
jgi:hypothetical protein